MSDINMTGEVKEINLLDMMGGAAQTAPTLPSWR